MLLMSYVLGAPYIAFFGERYFPAAKPIFEAIYAPLVYVSRDPDAPGHSAFLAYLKWSRGLFDQAFPLPAPATELHKDDPRRLQLCIRDADEGPPE